MIKTLAVNDNNDLYLDNNGNIAMSYGLQAILEQCEQVAKVMLGEMIFAQDAGIPFFDTVWRGTPNALQYEASLRQSILNVNGVIEITYLEVRQGAPNPVNTLHYEAIIKTIFGEGSING